MCRRYGSTVLAAIVHREAQSKTVGETSEAQRCARQSLGLTAEIDVLSTPPPSTVAQSHCEPAALRTRVQQVVALVASSMARGDAPGTVADGVGCSRSVTAVRATSALTRAWASCRTTGSRAPSALLRSVRSTCQFGLWLAGLRAAFSSLSAVLSSAEATSGDGGSLQGGAGQADHLAVAFCRPACRTAAVALGVCSEAALLGTSGVPFHVTGALLSMRALAKLVCFGVSLATGVLSGSPAHHGPARVRVVRRQGRSVTDACMNATAWCAAHRITPPSWLPSQLPDATTTGVEPGRVRVDIDATLVAISRSVRSSSLALGTPAPLAGPVRSLSTTLQTTTACLNEDGWLRVSCRGTCVGVSSISPLSPGAPSLPALALHVRAQAWGRSCARGGVDASGSLRVLRRCLFRAL